MEDRKIYEFYTKQALNAQIKAFNDGFEMGEQLAKEQYDGK